MFTFLTASASSSPPGRLFKITHTYDEKHVIMKVFAPKYYSNIYLLNSQLIYVQKIRYFASIYMCTLLHI